MKGKRGCRFGCFHIEMTRDDAGKSKVKCHKGWPRVHKASFSRLQYDTQDLMQLEEFKNENPHVFQAQRDHPFEGMSNPVAQVVMRCNVDVKYLGRAFAEDDLDKFCNGSFSAGIAVDASTTESSMATAEVAAGASAKRAREFLEQYDAKYVEMKEPRTCFMTSSSDLSRSASFSVAAGLKAQKLLQESRKEKEQQLVDASDDEMMPDVSVPVEVPVDIAPEMCVTSVSPADMALGLLQQRLPTRQASGFYEISVDQYSIQCLCCGDCPVAKALDQSR